MSPTPLRGLERVDPAIGPPRPPEEPPLPPTGGSPPPSGPRPAGAFLKFARVVSLVLLFGTASLMLTGLDPKPNLPPPPRAVAAAEAETIPDEIVVDLRDNV